MELHIIVPIWNVFFLAMCIGISVFCVGLIVRGCLSETRWPLHSFALIAFFLIMFAQSADALNQLISPESDISWMFAITLPMVPALGGCMWFYVIGLTSPDRRFLRADLWHLLPIAIIVACTLPFLLLPQDQRQSFLGESVNLQSRGQVVAVTFMLVGWLTWLAILASYGVASMRRLFQYRAQVKELLSNVDGVSLTWLHVLIVIIFTVTGLTIIASLMPVTVSMSRIADFLAPLFYFCVVFAVGSFGVLQDSVIPNWSELDLNIGSKKKYERSTLQVKDMLRIASKLHERMKQDQLWQNPNLSLNDISKATGISQNNISQTLNDHLGQNFYDYVNGWRINAACEALRDSDLSILTISIDVGFNAKSTFNAAFKKVTSQTPRQFRNGSVILTS